MQEVKRPKKPLIYFYVAMILAILVFNCLVVPYLAGKAIENVDYGTFMTMTENGEIGKVQIQQNQIVFTDKEESTIYRTGVIEDPGLVERLHASGATFTSEIIEETSPLATLLLSWLLPIGVFALLGQFMSKKLMDKAGGGAGSMMFNLGKSNAKVYVKSSDGIRFSDVEGVDEAEENLQEIVDYLENPAKYREIGASMPKGVLLVGPPGTGKTMLAKAVAGEANVPFFSMSGSEFVEMFVGMGASKVRDLFRQAKEKAPCIVFIDEIDAIGQKRSGGQYGGNDEREQTLNQLLTEMDGFDGSNGVIILAARFGIRKAAMANAVYHPGKICVPYGGTEQDLHPAAALLPESLQRVQRDVVGMDAPGDLCRGAPRPLPSNRAKRIFARLRRATKKKPHLSVRLLFGEEENLESEPQAHESIAASISLKFTVSASSL